MIAPAYKTSNRGIACLVLCMAVVCTARQAAAEQFLLHDPANPQTQTLVDISEQDMTVVMNPNTPQAREYYYTRHALLDSPDGRYWAYERAAVSQYIRWPVDGRGYPLTFIGNGPWQPSQKQIVALPQPPPPPQPTVTTQVVPNRPLPAATIELVNTHREDIVVSLVDKRDPNGRGTEIRIPAGGSAKHQIERDAGATQQTLLISPSGDLLEVLDEQLIPPAEIYDVVVYEYKIVSVYIDRTGKDRTVPARFRPPSTTKGLRSIGVFPIPGGDVVTDGAQIDAYGAAKYQRNPGAAGRFAAPSRARR